MDRFKKVSFNSKNYFDELIPYFYKDLPAETAFQIRYNNDSSLMSDDFSNQYDELYSYGARNITNNKNYNEEFEYFAPLYLNRKLIPSNFIIFRVDGPGLGISSKENFNDELVKKFKTVKLFNLKKETPVGEWLDINFVNNNYFPETPLEMDFRNLEFCKWNGIDYQTGGYTSKSLFIDDVLDEEKEIFELEKFIFDNYKNNKVVFPNILNLSFLFDDEPSTPDVKRKWSLNRYFGFYLDDMQLSKTISPYITPFLRPDVIIQSGNILHSISNIDPFLEGWSDTRPFYIEYDGNYYIVQKFTEEQGTSLQQQSNGNTVTESYQTVVATKYRIISDIDLTGKESYINKNFGIIDESNKILNYDLTDYQIDNFDDADVWVIEIDGIYHNLISDSGVIKLNTDYSFIFNENDYSYKVAGVSKSVSFIVDYNNPPKKFNIYKLRFSDIKTFDDKIIDTEYSKYEYEKESDLTITDETKMYLDNLYSKSNPKDLDDFIYNDEVVNIPVSSEYTANYETFKIEKNELTDLWRINSVHCRWGYQNSLSANDYPYLLNNSEIFEDFNRTCNPFDPDPKRIERNLDYFYTINSSSASYVHHTLHLERVNDNDIDTSFRFELDKYLNLATYSNGTYSATYSFDYFSYLFDNNVKFNNSTIKKNTKKYSEFNIGDNIIPNISLFRGIEFRMYDVDGVSLNTLGQIDTLNITSTNRFENYKFSVLLSDNEWSVDNSGGITSSTNNMDWTIIEDWKMDKLYSTGSIVIFDDILYEANTETITENPIKITGLNQVKSAPYNNSDWSYYTTNNIFWCPSSVYIDYDYVYNYGDYYYYNSTGTEDFWNPASASTGYDMNDIVLFKGKYYMSTTSSNNYSPDTRLPWYKIELSSKILNRYWVATQSTNPKWSSVELWNPSVSYTSPKLIAHNEILYGMTSSTTSVDAGEEPGISSYWYKLYSLVPDTNFIYQSTNNPIIEMNNRYYKINSNNSNSTLDNGIIIYINKKWKNILVNINIADNTLPNLSGTDRDLLYDDLYKKITAYNFILSINDLGNKYGFTDYINYVVIDEDGNIKKYDNSNIKDLPYLITCEVPDKFDIKVFSLTKTPLDVTSKLKPLRYLKNRKITNLSELNYYTDIPLATSIVENSFAPKVFENYHGNKNIVSNEIYRYSGYYMPLFYDIQLFKKDDEYKDRGNYKFDTSLTDFGIIKERRIRKVNLKGSVLKLKDYSDVKSIYPMLDEFGYTTTDFFIFRSTWDYKYHLQTLSLNQNVNISPDIIQVTTPTVTIVPSGQPSISSQQNYNI